MTEAQAHAIATALLWLIDADPKGPSREAAFQFLVQALKEVK